MSRFSSRIFRFVFSIFLSSIFFNSHAKHNIVSFTLKNGLRVVCIEKKTTPIIFFSIWYMCGSKNDAISKSGVAHYLEHMAFVSNKMQFNNFLEYIGAERNAFTYINTICFHEIVPKEHIETVFQHESKRMISIDIDDKAFLSEKGAILEERSMRVDNDPKGAQNEVLLANLFNRQIGGIEIIGWKHEIEGLQKEDLYAFHDKWFAPNNAVIIISGDFDLDQIKSLVEKYFGPISEKKIDKTLEEKTDSLSTNQCLKEVKYSSPKNGPYSSVSYIFRIPFQSKSNLRKAIALEVAMMAMNQPTFFVKKMLEDVYKCASTVWFEFIDRVFQYDIAVLEISSRSIDDLHDAEDIWRYLKKKLVHEGITKSQLDKVKKKYLISLAYKKDDIVKMSNYFGWLLVCGYSLEEIQSIDDIVQSITEKECNDLIKEVFSQDPHFIARTVPKGYDRE